MTERILRSMALPMHYDRKIFVKPFTLNITYSALTKVSICHQAPYEYEIRIFILYLIVTLLKRRFPGTAIKVAYGAQSLGNIIRNTRRVNRGNVYSPRP